MTPVRSRRTRAGGRSGPRTWAELLRLPALFGGSGVVPGRAASDAGDAVRVGRVGVGVGAGAGGRGALRAWAELLRLPALFTVPGDVLAGAAAVSARPGRRMLLAVGTSLCLYEAGMALNDWADRDEDAVERPQRPVPSGRIHPTAALTAACAFTAAGLALASRAGRPALAVATPLAATVWAYDLKLKHTPAGPVAMAAARGLDLLLGAAATRPTPVATRHALTSAALLSTHTLALTTVSRHETTGGATVPPLAALATTGTLGYLLSGAGAGTDARDGDRGRTGTKSPAGRGATTTPGPPSTAGLMPGVPDAVGPTPAAPGAVGPASGQAGTAGLTSRLAGTPGFPTRMANAAGRTPGLPNTTRPSPAASALAVPASAVSVSAVPALGRSRASRRLLGAALAVVYAATAARPYLHAALNPSPPLTQRAVGGGIRATIPLQAALSARAGAPVTALVTAALGPLAARFAKKVSVT